MNHRIESVAFSMVWTVRRQVIRIGGGTAVVFLERASESQDEKVSPKNCFVSRMSYLVKLLFHSFTEPAYIAVFREL